MENLDFLVLILYFIIILSVGYINGRNQASTSEYFLGEKKLPWYLIMFSVVATETSVLTFLSIPGLSYLGNIGFLQLSLGYIVGRILISIYLLPHYFNNSIESTYEILKIKLGRNIQRFVSMIFQITRVLADGVRLFMTAIPLSLITDWSYSICIFIITLSTLLYAIYGGIKSVVWADSIQFFIYFLGAFFTIYYLSNYVDGGINSIITTGFKNEKFIFLQFSNPFTNPYNFFTSFFGGIFLSLASHGTDHLMVQRLLSSKDIHSSRKALIGSGLIAFLQFSIFLFIGVGIWVFYDGKEVNANEVFSSFLINHIPSGMKGFLIAAIFSAAMSTLSSSINSLSSSTMTDWIKDIMPNNYNIKFSKFISFLWALIISFSALIFTSTTGPLIEIALSISSITYGGMLGFFVLNFIKKKIPTNFIFLSFISSILSMIYIVNFTNIAWPLFTLIGFLIMISFAFTLNKFFSK
ncbi:MAG: sodium:solute symporter [Candidatus Marinimicrobia bacterium]|nr:sodium:solute symporter [Candidatus Neomarinimicrobiota bacterium]